ncbi:aldehyde dehydrogenase family protein [Microbacterium trichothecenolyticum]|uniref:aldehyde dehydrogenase family protein n=1 Tax=Microbacterium trichothecenolyticum TaxID=69370 RepID=UPI001C6E9536|nr:aldehyde dehydrogenase family protein [Microbacterium trichothecenolyticum]MBW9122069.1 aldehyde dehydrogenase family protein [Microbacterium trichothecenolyticum]
MAIREDVSRVFELQSEYKWVAKNTSAEYRISQLRKLREAIVRYAPEIERALKLDMGKPDYDPFIEEVVNTLHPIDDAINNLRSWMAPTTVTPSPGNEGVREEIRYESRGVVLIFGPWNFPFQLLFEPLVPALAAGNTVIMKPNEVTPHTAAVSAKLIRETFDEREVAIFEGGVDLANELLELPVDHIFFTGSPAVGKIIMSAAAKHLASVTLELGGKCPAIIDRTVNIDEVAKSIGAAKSNNNGQLCLSPDYVLIDETVKDQFVDAYLRWVDNNLYLDGRLDPAATSHIVDDRNLARVLSYVEDARARGADIVRGGDVADGIPDMIEPAVIVDAPADSAVMREEIFGPILPVQGFAETSTVVDTIRRGTKPLAMYLFSNDDSFVNEVVDGTSSGGVTVNAWASHWGEPRLPFGGVNHSGIGRYHGVWGFQELSHAKPIMRHAN